MRLSLEAGNRQCQALLAACALRDQRTCGRLCELTSGKRYGIALRILNREDWAQDCLQEAYIKVWNKAGHYRPALTTPITWMGAVVRNQALDLRGHCRQEIGEGMIESLPEERDPHPFASRDRRGGR